MKRSEISDFVSQVRLFRDFSSDELDQILGAINVREMSSGELLFEENSPREYLFIIQSGEVELYKTTSFGDEKRLAYFPPYDFLGEGVFMDDYPHSTSARAITDTVVLTISRSDFEKTCEENPHIGMKLLSRVARTVSRRIRQASTRMVNIAAQYVSGRTRSEHDLLGDREVPHEFYYGVQTLRATENFSITGINLSHFPVLVKSLAVVKLAAAKANAELGELDRPVANAIFDTCAEILNGKLHTHFVVDMIQGGAGTSTNMNANEVIANRALEFLGHERGEYEKCHPNNHVNLSQSTNDAYPTALKIALIFSNDELTNELKSLVESFRKKAHEFTDTLKMGRTQLQDAVPMTLGQEFESYATTLEEEIERLDSNADLFLEVNMGGTAIGTGINAPREYPAVVVGKLREITGLNIALAENLVEATQDTGAFVMYSSATKRLAIKLSKISSDLRLLSSGPRAGLNEINLPPMQPGSSIMPGKVNPVIPEVVNQIAYKVVGNDLTVTMAAEAGQLELNVMEPVIAQSIFESIEMLKNGIRTLKYRCVDGITSNAERCREMVQNSIGLVTALNPVLGYEVSSALAKEAHESGRGIYELVLEKGLMSQETLDELLKPENMV